MSDAMKRISIALLLVAAACDRVIDALHSDVPRIFDMLPNAGPSTGNVTVTLEGAFCERPAVTLDGERVQVNLVEPTQVVITMPPHAIGEVELSLDCDGRSVVSETKFRYYASNVALDARLTAPPADRVLGFADFDDDGIDDMIGVYVREKKVKIFPGTRQNAFETKAILEFSVGDATEGAIFDLELDTFDRDGDARADLTLLYSANALHAGEPGVVASSFAKSSEAYRIQHDTRIMSGAGGLGIAAVDLDGDGMPDLVTNEGFELVLYATSLPPGEKRVVLNDSYVIDFAPRTMHGDFNEDGVEDLAIGPQHDLGGELDYVLGSASGAFSASVVDVPASGELIDFDADRWPDLVSVSGDVLCVQRGISATAVVGLGYAHFDFNKGFAPLEILDTYRARPAPVPSWNACVDTNGDGLLDLVLREEYLRTMHVLRNASR